MKIAVLDDYQHLARQLADWSALEDRCVIDVFHRRLSDGEITDRLAPYDILSLVRERTALPGSVISSLPNLKFIAATGPHNRTIDFSATRERGIVVSCTTDAGLGAATTVELAWGLILSCVRKIPAEDRDMRRGGWQSTNGSAL
jgi:phosphoglycerate dehydrogenase-like enzyme